MKTKSQLLELIRVIKNETRVGANTATRLGSLLEEFVYSMLHQTEGRGYVTVNYLYELNVRYPNALPGDCALVVKATSSSAGWAYWDDQVKRWRMMEAGGSTTGGSTSTSTTTTIAPNITTTTTSTTPTPISPTDVSITTTKGLGIKTVSSGGIYKQGAVVNLICDVDDLHEFDGWYEGEAKVWPNIFYSFTAIANRQLQARGKSLTAITTTTTTTKKP